MAPGQLKWLQMASNEIKEMNEKCVELKFLFV